MILSSIGRCIGVNLISHKTVWEKSQIHYTIDRGLMYYAGPDWHGDQYSRIFRVCNPQTGVDTQLYSEFVR